MRKIKKAFFIFCFLVIGAGLSACAQTPIPAATNDIEINYQTAQGVIKDFKENNNPTVIIGLRTSTLSDIPSRLEKISDGKINIFQSNLNQEFWDKNSGVSVVMFLYGKSGTLIKTGLHEQEFFKDPKFVDEQLQIISSHLIKEYPIVDPMLTYPDLESLGEMEKRVSMDGKPTVISFMANWCSDCVELHPAYEKIKKENSQRINFIDYDITEETIEERNVAKVYNLTAVPTFFVYDADGQLAFIAHSDIEEVVNKILQ